MLIHRSLTLRPFGCWLDRCVKISWVQQNRTSSEETAYIRFAPCVAVAGSRYLPMDIKRAVVMCVAVLLLGTWYVVQRYHFYDLNRRQPARGPGFGPEKGVYNFTVVTGLFDVGRGRWRAQSRTYHTYLNYFLDVLRLDVNLVAFIESKGMNFVRRARQGRESRTVVMESTVSELPCYKDLARVKEIMADADFQAENENWRQGKVEAVKPLYDVVTNSKAHLVRRAVDWNPFNTSYVIWLDAGISHGNKMMFPPDGVWHPRHLLAVPERVTFTALRPLESFRNLTQRLHKLDTAAIAGGLFGGGNQAVLRYCRLHDMAWKQMLQSNVVDDDQTTFTLAYFMDPDNFRPVPGNFFDLVKPWT